MITDENERIRMEEITRASIHRVLDGLQQRGILDEPEVQVTQDEKDPNTFHFITDSRLPHGKVQEMSDILNGVFSDGKDPSDTFIQRYFDHEQHYPTLSGDILPLGHWWVYVPDAFLNGVLNFSSHLSAFLITRYHPHSKNQTDVRIQTERESPCIHPKLGELFQDDIVLLGQTGPGQYWVFWYDRDVSDCCVGRFQTDDKFEEVKDRFAKWAEERSQDLSMTYSSNEGCNENAGGKPALLLPLDKFQGWLSF